MLKFKGFQTTKPQKFHRGFATPKQYGVGAVFAVSPLSDPKKFVVQQEKLLSNASLKPHVIGQMALSLDFKSKMNVDLASNKWVEEADCYVLCPHTGGTENMLKYFGEKFRKPILLMGNNLHNSMAAAIELREFFRNKLIPAHLVRNDAELNEKLEEYKSKKEIHQKFLSLKLGLIGDISPWLINEEFSLPYSTVPIQQLIENYHMFTNEQGFDAVKHLLKNQQISSTSSPSHSDIEKAGKTYLAIQKIVQDNHWDGYTIGCFELIGKIAGTPCLSMAIFNTLGKVAACEGELNSLLGMLIVQRYFDQPTFMANVVDYNADQFWIAHCTAPFFLEQFQLKSHFESEIGVAVEQTMPTGVATVYKVRGRNVVISKVEVQAQEHSPLRCRTQLCLKMKNAKGFLDKTLGNHHLLAYVPAEKLAELMKDLGFNVYLHDV